MSDPDENYELPDAIPVPADRFTNLFTLVLFWASIIGLAFPAWTIGAPWGWFVYAGTVILIFGLMELQALNNILVRTLPALRLLLVETKRLRALKERRFSDGQK